MLGDNHGNVYVNLTGDYPPQPYALKIKLSFGLTGHLGLDDYVHTLVVEALNIGSRTSYVSKVLFENIVDGETRVTNIYDHGKSQALHRFGEPLHPGQAHDYHYHLDDFYIFGTLGQQVIPVAIHVPDQIGNTYREPYTDEMSKSLVQHYNKQHA